MNKAEIILSALGVLAVIGSALLLRLIGLMVGI